MSLNTLRRARKVEEGVARLLSENSKLRAALTNVHKLISEAAMTGFNCHDGDWAERLFASQHLTSAALEKATGKHNGSSQ